MIRSIPEATTSLWRRCHQLAVIISPDYDLCTIICRRHHVLAEDVLQETPRWGEQRLRYGRDRVSVTTITHHSRPAPTQRLYLPRTRSTKYRRSRKPAIIRPVYGGRFLVRLLPVAKYPVPFVVVQRLSGGVFVCACVRVCVCVCLCQCVLNWWTLQHFFTLPCQTSVFQDDPSSLRKRWHNQTDTAPFDVNPELSIRKNSDIATKHTITSPRRNSSARLPK